MLERLWYLQDAARPPLARPEEAGALREWEGTVARPDGSRERLRFRGLEKVGMATILCDLYYNI